MFEQNITLGPGTGTLTQHTFEILIMLLGAFMIGLWLGWAIWAKYKQQIDKMTLETQSLNVSTDALRTELSTLKGQIASLEGENSNLSSESVILQNNNAGLQDKVNFLEAELARAQARVMQMDTELGLAKTPEAPKSEDITLEVNEPAPENSAPIVKIPTNTKLKEDQPEPIVITPAEAERALAGNATAPSVIEPVSIKEPEKKKSTSKKGATSEPKSKAIAVAAVETDDLTVIEGIGPKIQMLLNQYDIVNYKQLADTEVERLKEILATAGPQLAMHDPGTWPSQANLAANDQWDTLKSVQGFLKGGKKPT